MCPSLLLQSHLPTLSKVIFFLFFQFFISMWILLAHVLMSHTCDAALEPFFSAAATQFILGQQVPFSLWLSLAPVVIGM
jgi:hypothetical protein